jgi:hypothetical protein
MYVKPLKIEDYEKKCDLPDPIDAADGSAGILR